MKFIFPLLCFLAFFLIYVLCENNLLAIRKYTVSSPKSVGKKLKIVQISDIHSKKNFMKIYAKTRRLNPDIILLTGDIVSRRETKFKYLDILTQLLAKICPVYACPGNHELDLSEDNYKKYKHIMQKNGIRLLENEQTAFQKDENIFNIAGASLKKSVYKNPDGGYSDLEEYTAEELESDIGKKNGVTILLAHNPLCADAYKNWNADIVFCGHIHGGSVRLPVIGGVLSPERKFFPKYSKGLYKLGKTTMIVSGGIGKPRIFNPPEIVYCELEY
ncbi:MAG: metallophosphoesterase [Ruminococcus sp.]|nr:metallophosphoesterase [Ruminococcus sp.]